MSVHIVVSAGLHLFAFHMNTENAEKNTIKHMLNNVHIHHRPTALVGYDKFWKTMRACLYIIIYVYLFVFYQEKAQPVENKTLDFAFTLQYCVKKWMKHNWQTRENFLLYVGAQQEHDEFQTVTFPRNISTCVLGFLFM